MRETEKVLRGTESTNTVCEFGGRTEPSERGDSCFGLSGGPDSPGSTCGTCLPPPPQVPLSGLGLSANAAFLVLTYTFQGRRLVLLGAQDLVWCLGHPRHAGAVRRLGGSSEADRSSWGTEEETGTVTAQPSVGGRRGRPPGMRAGERGLASALAAGCPRCTPEAVRGLAPSGRDGRLCTGRERNRVRGIIEDFRKDLLFGRASTSGLSWAPAER